jgi:zona occludens toxin
MPSEVQYVFDLCSQSRARLAGVAQMEQGQTCGVIEWRLDQGPVQERMTFDQLRALGVTVEVHPYGVKLAWKGQGVVVTPWPLDQPSPSSSDAASASGVTASAAPRDAHNVSTSPESSSDGSLHTGVGPQAYVPPSWEHTDTGYLKGGSG